MPQRKTTRKTTKKEATMNRQAMAVILFAVAVLLLCIILIPGGSLWGFLHNLAMGCFGWCAYAVPILLGYVAIAGAMETEKKGFSDKRWQLVMLLVLISTAIEIFVTPEISTNYFDALLRAFNDGVSIRGGGLLGAVLGYPAKYLFTDVGSKIIIILLIFVFAMLVTGTTIVSFLKVVWKPVEKTKETLETAMETRTKTKKPRRSIHVDLDDEPQKTEAPMEPVEDSESLAAFKRMAEEINQEPEPTPAETIKANKKTDISKDVEAFTEEVEEKAEEKKNETYVYPPLSLLNESKSVDTAMVTREQNATADLLVQTLQEFGVSAKVIHISHGPTVTRYELQPSAGVKISRITGLADDIALRLATTGVRIEAPIPNKAAVGIEVPNRVAGSVCLRELIGSKEFKDSSSRLTVALGKDIAGQIVLTDLAKMPHLLIAGTTGSGKSVCTNSMIQSVLFHARPDEVRLLLIDPKQVEFGIYNGIPHLLVPVVTDPHKAAGALGWAVTEMLRRYKLFADNNVRDIGTYNELAKTDERLEHLPQILIVIDELADLMMVAANAVESNICRLAQMARAAGMHLVIATQRPSVDVITGLIKANIPSRLALTVASAVDSRTILDTGGAEKLLGKGDMLFMPVGFSKPMRVQGCFVGNREVESVVDFLKSTESMQYDEAVIQEIERQAQATEKSSSKASDDEEGAVKSDEMLPRAVEVVLEAGMASTSLLQRRLSLGYARAGRIIDDMAQRGIIGPHEGSKPRQVLITRQQWLEMNMLRSDEDEVDE